LGQRKVKGGKELVEQTEKRRRAKMKRTYIIFNWFVLIVGLSMWFLVISDSITFGYGLGDLFYFVFLSIILLVQILLNFTFSAFKRANRNLIVGFVFSLIYSFFIHQLTIGRGSEYPWNGQIFHYDTKQEKN
jgi:hypothetical protein